MNSSEVSHVWIDEGYLILPPGVKLADMEIGCIEGFRFVESPLRPYPQLPQRSRRAQWKQNLSKYRYCR